MSCSTNRCFMLNGGSGNQARVLPQAENTPYPEGAGSASEAARMNGNVNINNQLEMSKAFKGGSGGRIVVAQPAEVSQSQSGSQSANHTSQSLAVSLTQGNENASMDSQVGAGRRRRMRKSKRNKKSKNHRKTRKANKTRKMRKSRKMKKLSKGGRRKTQRRRNCKKGGNVDTDPSKIAEYIKRSARWSGENQQPNESKAISIIKQPNFNPNQMSAEGEPLIHLAYKAGNKTILEMLIKNPKIDNNHAEDVLREAIARNNEYIVNLFKKNKKVPAHLKSLV